MAELEKLQEWSLQRITAVPTAFRRYPWTQINWRDRLIIIVGARGVGKSTLLLQHMKERLPLGLESLYASLDHLYFSRRTLVDLAEDFVQRGGRYLVLDEVHKYPTWSREVKIIYDQFPKLQLLLSGSSTIEVLHGEGDLSRRARIYRLHGLSFREFIEFGHGIKFEPAGLEQLLSEATLLSADISQKVKPIKLFAEYLQYGYYPFFKEDLQGYGERLRQTVNVVLESDIPAVFHVDYGASLNMKKLLGIITEMMPFKPNIQKLSRQVNLSRETLIKYLQHLGRADILNLLYSEAKGVSLLNKPEKVYLHNTNLIYALGQANRINKGSLRETFFLNQLKNRHQVRYTRKGDFIVDDRYTFEVGDPNKDSAQIRDIPNAWVAADDIEIGVGKRIPLWLFGFLY